MRLADWQALAHESPESAARSLHAALARLPTAQRRAIFAWEASETDLLAAFERSGATGGPLGGVPYALKDLFAVSGHALLAGGRFLPAVRPPARADGALAATLARAGAVLAGRTHLHEFAYGLTGENPHYGDVEHPAHPGRTSGGSSSGSAAAVAAGVVPLAIGTDTGGSIRVPAAFCGLYGLRLTPHHAWIADAFPLAASFDTPGWLTASASDLATVTGALIGLGRAEREPRGVYVDFAALGVTPDPGVADACARAAMAFAPPADPALANELGQCFGPAAEAYAVLQSTEAYAVHAEWLDARRAEYEPGVWQRIDRGRRWTAAQLEEAQLRQSLVRLAWTRCFLGLDFLILPATPFPALRKADCTLANRNRLLALTAPASLGGLPVLTIPVTLPDGLTTGLQIVINQAQSPVIPWVLARCGSC